MFCVPISFRVDLMKCFDSLDHKKEILLILRNSNMSDWSRLSMFMDGRFLNVTGIGFEIIISEN
jgi:hypothetical protein